MRRVHLLCGSIAAAATVLAACHSIGPETVARDRFDYSAAISDSWKRQTLLNVVKLRYVDMPIFVDVGQIVSGYSLESTVSLGGQVSSAKAVQGNGVSLGAQGRFTDRPTITYTPLTGDRFLRGLMTPIPPESLLSSIQSGWAADIMLELGVSVINGIRNEGSSRSGAGYQNADPRFARVAALMRKIQLSSSVSISVQKGKDGEPSTVIAFRSPQIDRETLNNIHELRDLLGLDQEAEEFTLVRGDVARNNHEIALRSRSLLHAITALSTRVVVPQRDLTDGRAFNAGEIDTSDREFKILNSGSEPGDAFVSVHYRDHWFYIDDRDLVSKRALLFIMLLFTLADTGTEHPAPLLTIPTQ
ncbi:MAG TPA: hypothetical protein VEZ88_00320 [Steroidobacteraceae bacterium]|nr:hypothetical protein [Steroidobacteraceae bacterium]